MQLKVIRHPFFWIALSSMVWALCYPPFPLGPLSFIVLVPAFLATSRLEGKRAFKLHFMAGILYNTLMYWWIYLVMKVGPSAVILFGLIALILFLSLFNGLLGWLFRACLKVRFGIVAFPFLWAGLEVARSLGEMSFPWNNMGYTLGSYLPFIQGASWIGVYGLSAAIVGANCLWFQFFRSRFLVPGHYPLPAGGSTIPVAPNSGSDSIPANMPEGRPNPGILEMRWAIGGLAIPGLLLLFGIIQIGKPDPMKDGVTDISLVQPSIPQTKKWDEDYFREVMQKTWDTMDKGPKGGSDRSGSHITGSDLVVLAETAIPDFLRTRPDLMEEIRQLALRYNSSILVGALDLHPTEANHRAYHFFNSAFLFTPGDTAFPLQYSKLRLVPFSERLPFEDILPIINYVNLGEGDFSPEPTM